MRFLFRIDLGCVNDFCQMGGKKFLHLASFFGCTSVILIRFLIITMFKTTFYCRACDREAGFPFRIPRNKILSVKNPKMKKLYEIFNVLKKKFPKFRPLKVSSHSTPIGIFMIIKIIYVKFLPISLEPQSRSSPNFFLHFIGSQFIQFCGSPCNRNPAANSN